MVNVDKNNAGFRCRLLLAPNQSICWRELLLFYLCTCVLALALGLLFLFHGFWLVLPFSGLEMLALGLALYITSLRSHRREVITFMDTSVRVEKVVGKSDRNWEFEKFWLRLNDGFSTGINPRRKLELGSHGKYVEVGEFLSNIEKDELAFQLKDCIIRA